MGTNISTGGIFQSKEALVDHEQTQRIRYQQDKILNPNPIYYFKFGSLDCALSRDIHGLESFRTDTWVQKIEIENTNKLYMDEKSIDALKKTLKGRSICVNNDDKCQRIYIFQDYSVSYPPGNTENYRKEMKNNKTYYVDFLQAKEDLERIVDKYFYKI
jgi:hypothetical protein